MAHMTWEQAFIHAFESARITQHRYRVFRSRSVVGWWNVVQICEHP